MSVVWCTHVFLPIVLSHSIAFRQSLRLEPTKAIRQKEADTTIDTLPSLHPLRVTKSQEDLLTPGAEAVEPPKFSTPRPLKQTQLRANDRSHSSLGIEGHSPSASKKSITMPRLGVEHKNPSSGALNMGETLPLATLPETPERKRFLGSPWLRGHQKSKSVGTK